MNKIASNNLPLTNWWEPYKNRNVAIKIEITPNVGALVAACSLVKTPGNRLIPNALEKIKNVPDSNKIMMIIFMIISIRSIRVAFNNNTHFNIFCDS